VFEGADDHVLVRVGAVTHRVRTRLRELEAQLAPRRLARVHRSVIVNLDRVREVQPMFRGDAAAILQDGRRLPVSARYRKELLARLGLVL
jgi:two-component system LytT family response regulator